jgi:hypothetical protein
LNNYYKDAGSFPLYKDNKGNVSAFVYELAKKSGRVSLNYNALDKIRKYGRIIGFESVFNEEMERSFQI